MLTEFEFIKNLKSKYALNKIGDDCAVLPKDASTDLLLTADLLIEDIDFRLKWTTPEFIGHKSLAVSLSDVAAMCGVPKWAMLSIGVPERLWKTDFVDRFYEGWFALANKYEVELVGGDVSRSIDKLVIDSIVGGDVPKGKGVLRSTASVGNAIFISGTVGAAAGGLKLLENGIEPNPENDQNRSELLLKQLKPSPHLILANILQLNGIATSCIDVSDGLSSDLRHICEASGLGAELYLKNFPVDPNLEHYFPIAECQDLAINGGEDLGLLFTAQSLDPQLFDQIKVTQIGQITGSTGHIKLIGNGLTKELFPQGFRHF